MVKRAAEEGKRVSSAIAVAVLTRELFDRGLERYTSCFQGHGAEAIASLDDDMLQGLGIDVAEHRATILGIIHGSDDGKRDLRDDESVGSTATHSWLAFVTQK